MRVRVIGKYRTSETGTVIKQLPATDQALVQMDGCTGLDQTCYFKRHEVDGLS